MATWRDVERLAGGLPEVTEGTSWGNRAWKVTGKTFVWERPLRKQDRAHVEAHLEADLGGIVPEGPVLGVRVADEGDKRELLAAEPDVCFTIPHFDGYPAVLVRLDQVDVGLLTELITDAWRARASPKLLRADGD